MISSFWIPLCKGVYWLPSLCQLLFHDLIQVAVNSQFRDPLLIDIQFTFLTHSLCTTNILILFNSEEAPSFFFISSISAMLTPYTFGLFNFSTSSFILKGSHSASKICRWPVITLYVWALSNYFLHLIIYFDLNRFLFLQFFQGSYHLSSYLACNRFVRLCFLFVFLFSLSLRFIFRVEGRF